MKRWKWHLKTTEILRFETAGSVKNPGDRHFYTKTM